MAPIKGRKLWLAKALGDREHACVDEPNVSIGLVIAQLADAWVVFDLQILDSVRARAHVVQQSDENARMQALLDPVVHLKRTGQE